jgi:rhodanese-related sulfurtransferase
MHEELTFMKRYTDLVNECVSKVQELFPWDLDERLEEGEQLLLIDIREPYEFSAMHIDGSINVPRGILESACEFNYEETVPALAGGRDKDIIVICRSGLRSVLASYVMQLMVYQGLVVKDRPAWLERL